MLVAMDFQSYHLGSPMAMSDHCRCLTEYPCFQPTSLPRTLEKSDEYGRTRVSLLPKYRNLPRIREHRHEYKGIIIDR